MNSVHFNKLTPAEHERLTIIMEECGEVIQAIGKIFKHGYESTCSNGKTNRSALERELGDLRQSMIYICEKGDLSKDSIHYYADMRLKKMQPYLHHQED